MSNAFGRIRPKLRSKLELADENIDRLSGIISNFFDIFEVDSGRVELEKTPVGIDLIVGEAVAKFSVEAEEKNVVITMSPCGEGLYVDVDQARICQAIGNIIENAIRFVPEGGHVEVRICDAGDELRVDIEDNGPGIKQDDIEKVFNRFIQIDKEVGPGDRGTGLGLPIAKKLIELHGGRIWVESTIGAGSNFCFTLPKFQKSWKGNRVILSDEPETIPQL